MFNKGIADAKEKDITGSGQFTDPIQLDCGESCSLSFDKGTLADTLVAFQRSFDGGVLWRAMSNSSGDANFSDSIELQYVAAERCLVRAGCPDTYGSGEGSVRVGKG